jgi:hypothetical protein
MAKNGVNQFLGMIEYSSTKDRIFWVPGAMGVDFGEILRALNKKKKAQHCLDAEC